MRLLIIEDEAGIRRELTGALESSGFQVDSCSDGKEGYYLATEFPYDAAIIDLGLPGMPGIEIIKGIRGKGLALPIMVLTARARWQQKVEGLDAGADDYLAKPFQMEELEARLKALLRRTSGSSSNFLICGPVTLDMKAQKGLLNGCDADLTAFEYRMLEYLMRARGKVVPKAELSDYLYPHDEDRDSNVLEVLVGRLRRKLDPEGDLAPIETLRGRGYRFRLQEKDVA